MDTIHEMNVEKEEELAYSIGEKYFSIQTSKEGYDYTFYDEDYLDLDGGIYENLDISITEAAKKILVDEGYSLEKAQKIDYEELMEHVDAAADEEMEWIAGMEMEWIAEMQEIVLMEKKGESTMILIMQYLDFNLPNFLLWTVMIFFTVYPLVTT